MKKVVSIILVAIICIIGTISFALSFNVSTNTNKSSYVGNDEVEVNVKLSNIQTDLGVIAFMGTLEYDTSSLTYQGIEALNGWNKPSYNSNNGIFLLETDNPITKNTEILKIKFKVKSNVEDKTAYVKLKELSAGDGGDAPAKVNDVTQNIVIKSVTKPDDKNNTTGNAVRNTTTNTIVNNTTGNLIVVDGNNTTNGNTKNNIDRNQTPNSVDKVNTTGGKKLPYAGTGICSVIVILAIIALSVFAYMKYRKDSRK